MENKKLPNFNLSEFFLIKREVESCDSFYSSMFNLTNMKYSNDIETACITFDKQGNSLDMLINYNFWKNLNDEAKKFVILHELSHVIFNHGKRAIDLGLDFSITNIASDIVINHHLHKNFNVNRDLFDWEKYCWVETCFKDEVIDSNKNFEFYYKKLMKTKLPKNQLLGNHANQTEKTNENEKNNSNSEEKKEIPKLEDILNQNPELIEEFKNSENIPQKIKDEIEKKITITPPLGKELNSNEKVFNKESYIEPNFEKLLKLLIPKKNKKDFDLKETWVGQHRRYLAFLNNNKHIVLPNIKEQEKESKKKKKQIWVFIDTSGSCHGLFNHFSSIVKKLLGEKDLICRAFAFGDNCREVEVNPLRISFNSGNAGGFDCIEYKIKDIISKEKNNYPDNVVVLSDGYVSFGIKEQLEKPKNWVMLLTEERNKTIVPKAAKFIKVDDDFFGFKNKKMKP